MERDRLSLLHRNTVRVSRNVRKLEQPFPSEDLTAVDMKERKGDPCSEAGEDLGESEEPGLVGEQGDDHHRHVEHAADRQTLDPAPVEEGGEKEGAGEATE